MKVRAVLAEVLVRLALLCGAAALLRWAAIASMEWRERVQSTFEHTWGGWAKTLAFVAAAGFVAGLALLPSRPNRYRILMPLVIALPPLLLLAHYPLLVEDGGPGGGDLPSFLRRPTFYMDASVQYVLALVAGLGVASGLQPGRVAEGAAAGDSVVETTPLP